MNTTMDNLLREYDDPRLPGPKPMSDFLDWLEAHGVIVVMRDEPLVTPLPQTMRLDTQPGEKVVFHAVGGYPIENEKARMVLMRGSEYVVERVKVGGWSSEVYLKGIPHGFNTVMFSNAEKADD